MVKDHQTGSQEVAAASSRQESLFTRPAQTFQQLVCLVLFLAAITGCQSGLVDPGRPRRVARPPQQLMIPGPPSVQPTSPQGATTPGATAHDWKNVARQPATSVIKLSPTEDPKSQYHTVLPGETWSSLSRKFGLTVKQLTDANGIDPSATLQKGQIVYIP